MIMADIKQAMQTLDNIHTSFKNMNYMEWKMHWDNDFDTMISMFELSNRALQEKLERENPQPLTLEELNGMVGEPVWCVQLNGDCHWCVVMYSGAVKRTFGFLTEYEDIPKYFKSFYQHKPKEGKDEM